MNSDLIRRGPAANSISLGSALRALLLLLAVQAGAFCLFLFYSSAAFRLWQGGIFFYKSIALAAVVTVLLFVLLMKVSRVPMIDKCLSSAFLHRIWFSLLSASAQFCVIVLFIGFIPVTIDRSVSVYLLGTMQSKPEHAFSKAELETRLIRDYVHGYGAVDRRLAEQVASHNIEPYDDGFRLTTQGAALVRTMRRLAWIFNVDRRFVDPARSDTPEQNSEPQSSVR